MLGFKNNPFVRILIPFVAGILIYSAFQFNTNVIYPLLVSLFVLTLLYFRNRKSTTQNSRWLYLAASDVFLALAGFYCCYLHNIKNNVDYFGKYVNSEQQIWVGEIKDLPVNKDRFYKVLMEVKTLGNKEQLCGEVLVYVKKQLNISDLQPGNILKLESAFINPKPPLNPHEFDYETFLERKNIFYQSFVEADNMELLNQETDFSLMNFGLRIKQKIKNTFETADLNKEAAQLCTALLTGYDDEINPETINAFAHSGTLHVLSVSGLHTGILYGVIVFLLGLIDRHKKYKLLQLLVIVFVLWFFALITGFSPPVLRAVIMLNFIALGRFYYSYSNDHAINILAVSAFVILLFNPLLIYDTGFLLSYSAVAGILFFEPGFTSLVNSEHAIINKIWKLISVSLSAQITTLPITLYLFHQFPLWFIFSNLIVIPLCGALMFFGFLLLIKLSFVAPFINFFTSVIFSCIHLTDSSSYGYVDYIDFGWKDLVLFSLVIITITAFIKKRTYVYLSGTAVLIIVWQFISLVEVVDKKSASHLGIYHINKQSALDLKNGTNLFSDSNLSTSNYNYHVKPNHTFLNYPDIYSLNYDYVKSGNTSFLKLSSENQSPLIGFLKPGYLLVTNNSEINESYFCRDIKMVVADGSNSYSAIRKLKSLCDKFSVPFHSTYEKGYCQIGL